MVVSIADASSWLDLLYVGHCAAAKPQFRGPEIVK